MGLNSAIQSNLGQQMAGVNQSPELGLPFTETEVSIPNPMDVQFESYPTAAAGIGVIAITAVVAQRISQNISRSTNVLSGGDDMPANIPRSARSERRRSVVGASMLGIAGAAALAHAANPYVSESSLKTDRVAVVLDAGFDAQTRDVTNDAGEEDVRLDVAANAALSMHRDGLIMDIIMGGSSPELVATIEGPSDSEAAINAINEYGTNPRFRGSPDTGGGDIHGSLQIAEATGADTAIVFTDTFSGMDYSNVLESGTEKKAITLGRAGSTVDHIGLQEDTTPDFDDVTRVVGPENAYTADSTAEVREIMDEIIGEEIINEEKTPLDIFKQLSVAGLIGAGAMYSWTLLKKARLIPKRRNK